MYRPLMVLSGLTAMIIILSGCNGIPEGNPPEGNIVEPENNQNTFSSAAGVNRLITSLCAAVIKNVPAESIVSTNFNAQDKSLNFYANKVFAATVDLGKFKPPATPSATADFCLYSNIKGRDVFDWQMKLVRNKDNVVIWSETIKIDQSELAKQ